MRKSSVSISETEDEPAPKKRGRPPKAKKVSDDEAPKSKAATGRSAKTNGTSKKTRNANGADHEDEPDEGYESMKQWKDTPSWTNLVEQIDTVERQKDGELYVYFKLYVTNSSIHLT